VQAAGAVGCVCIAPLGCIGSIWPRKLVLCALTRCLSGAAKLVLMLTIASIVPPSVAIIPAVKAVLLTLTDAECFERVWYFICALLAVCMLPRLLQLALSACSMLDQDHLWCAPVLPVHATVSHSITNL
jgi:hypothetical protein